MALRYTSTRNAGVSVNIAEAIAHGMPEDGGLFVPSRIPELPLEARLEPNLSYAELAWLVMSRWFDWQESELRPLIEKAYAAAGNARNFDVPEIVPLTQAGYLGHGDGGMPFYLLELFHGKTCAFKDLALSLLGGLLRMSLEKCGIDEPVMILTATSGDTGSAALAGLGGQPGIRIAVIYPDQGTSEIQKLQMTSVPTEGRFVVGLRGNFDDAQRTVKHIFQTASHPDSPFHGLRLSSANSINMGRLLPQIVYYVKAWRDLYFSGALKKEGSFDVVVPSGNFGDILAAKYAKTMGLPIRKLVCASNSNRILHDFLKTGVYDRRRDFAKTLSPSMDILVSSNLERLIYLASGERVSDTAGLMRDFETKGYFRMPEDARTKMTDFSAGWADDVQTIAAIRHMWLEHKTLVDPHTAVACRVAHDMYEDADSESPAPIVVAATASPFKFPAACLSAIQSAPAAKFKNASDLELVAELARVAGTATPAPIAALNSATIRHDIIADDVSLIPLLAKFARGQQ